MKNALSLSISMIALGLSAAAPTFAAEEADSITAAIAGGDASLALRYRFEYVDDFTNREALASTVKTRLTYKTLSYNGVSTTLEMDNNSVVGEDNYSDSGADPDEEAVVLDATYTEINQAYIDFAAPADTLVRYGRQRINLDGQRMLGGVGWRQNEQTYDAFTLVNTALPDTTLIFSNVYNVNTFTGGDIDGNDHQVYYVNNKSIDGLGLSAYFLDLKDIHDTFGIRANGKVKASDDLTVLYTAEFAQQTTDDDNEHETNYLNLEAGVNVSGFTAKLGYETLGSDDGNAMFKTPLATKHKFNGWADKFAAEKGTDGLVDTSLSISTKNYGPKIAVIYHQFDADEGSGDLGSEIDILVAKKFSDNYTGLIKLADYSKGDSGEDTTKIWVQLAAKF
ncbi:MULTISPECIES: alginate export family protein [unclassified Oleiphilus]|uniref:alginate export family protein n=1 Tax=unclassified Oleiphilus TaxID=2631174 RepID=UPI0007C3CAF2|nr:MULTISPECIES: alginate export family protein [unclassified Oleiphilus]KZY36985.1 hypothetical protein A3729_03660 [Oleiphilus sp. HI0043]KZZ63132.1 hypothetical protein A3763_00575 [Oleiphilus sp. HI0128]